MVAEKRLSGRVALVTGASRGIGRAIALRLAQDGADVVINYRQDRAAAEEVASLAQGLGVRAQTVKGSVASFEDCAAMVAQTVKAFGSLGILINNAGISSRRHSVVDTEVEELEEQMGVNALGPFYLCKLVAPHLRRAPRSDVVFVSSISTTLLNANTAPYCMSKAAVEALASVFAKEEQAHGVRVNVVRPSLTATDMGQQVSETVLGVADMHQLDKSAPFGRISTPQDIASLVAYLVSPENFYISGQSVAIDGGAGN